MNYAQKIQYIQKCTAKNQTQLALLLGVSFVTLNTWINDKSVPRKKAQQKIDILFEEYFGNTNIASDVIVEKKKILQNLQKNHTNSLEILMSHKSIYNAFVLKMTYHTNSIEGSTFNEPEVMAVLFDDVTIPDKSFLEHQEAKNHQTALGFVMRWIRDTDEAITETLIQRIHEILMNGILHNAGQYRTHAIRIVGSHVPTTNPRTISKSMKEFIQEINKNADDIFTHIARTHALFEKIHPFSDGNGRVGRLLMIILALKHNLAPVLIQKEKKYAYYSYLQEAQIQKNYLPLTSFVYDAIFEGYKLFII